MTAITYLKQIAAEPCRRRTLLAQGILWAESSCRIDGTMAMALRNGSIDSGIRLLNLISYECGTMADAAKWLNENRSTVLDTLSRSTTKPKYTAIPIVFKILTYSAYHGWTDDPNFLGYGCVENENRWTTEYEAEAACEELHKACGFPLCNLRVVPAG